MADDEKGFEVIDKRHRGRNDATEPLGETAAEKATQEEAPSTAESENGPNEPRETASEDEQPASSGEVYSLVEWCVLMLAESAWQWMGLHPNPVTKQVKQDLAQAKIAVDSVVFLTDQIAPHISEEQRRAHRTLVTDLRMNFVEQQKRAAS